MKKIKINEIIMKCSLSCKIAAITQLPTTAKLTIINIIIIITIIFIRTRGTQTEQIIQIIDGTVQQILKITGE